MHVMEIVSGTGWNGAIGHCRLLARELVARGSKVTLVCLPESQVAQRMAGAGVEVVLSDLHRWPADELRRIAAIALESGVDVIHTHLSRAHFFGILSCCFHGIPCVATAHSRRIQVHWMFNDLVIAVSDATRRFHQRYNLVPRDRIVTIHNFIDYHRIAGVPGTLRAEVRASLGADEASCLIGVVGSIYPKKGQISLVRALPKILAAAPKTRLAAVGMDLDPRYAARVRSTAQKLGVACNILWTGHRENVPEILAALDVYVLPSHEENFPLSILEAMAAGLPVVASNVGGIPECVRHNETGMLVPRGDSDALAEAILGLAGDPARRRRFGLTGREIARRRFSPESQVAAIEAALAGAVRRGRRGRAA